MKKILIIISLHILLLANLQFIPWPENLTWPFFNLRGLSYYKDIFILYPPLYWELLSNFYRVAGISVNSLQVLSYAVIAVTDILLWYVAKKNWKVVAIYIPLQVFFEGNGIWVDHLLAPFFLLGYHFMNTKKYLLLGLCLGLAFVTKQTSLYFSLGCAGLLLIKKTTFRQFSKVLIGLGVILTALVVYLYLNKFTPYFWSDAVDYILFFHTRHPLQPQLPTLHQFVLVSLLYAPLIIRLIIKKSPTLLILLLSASLGIFTRFGYFHLQPALPFLAIALCEISWSIVVYLIFIVFFVKFLFSSWHQAPRFFNGFFLSRAGRIKHLVGNRQTLFVNTWDQYYLLTNSLPAGKFFVPSTPWTMDYPGNQEKIVSGLEKNPPGYIFFNDCFRVKNICYFPKYISQYINLNYRLVSKLSDGTGIFQYDPMTSP